MLLLSSLQDFDDKGRRFCLVTRSQWLLALFCHEISLLAGFVRFHNLSGGGLCFVMSFQKTAGFVPSLSHEISKTKDVGFVRLRDLSGFWLCSVMSFQKTAGFVYLLYYEIAKTKAVGFVPLRDLSGSHFWSVPRSQWLSALFCHELSKDCRFCSFALLRDFEDKGGRFCSVTRFHCWPVLLGSTISAVVGFVQS